MYPIFNSVHIFPEAENYLYDNPVTAQRELYTLNGKVQEYIRIDLLKELQHETDFQLFRPISAPFGYYDSYPSQGRLNK